MDSRSVDAAAAVTAADRALHGRDPTQPFDNEILPAQIIGLEPTTVVSRLRRRCRVHVTGAPGAIAGS